MKISPTSTYKDNYNFKGNELKQEDGNISKTTTINKNLLVGLGVLGAIGLATVALITKKKHVNAEDLKEAIGNINTKSIAIPQSAKTNATEEAQKTTYKIARKTADGYSKKYRQGKQSITEFYRNGALEEIKISEADPIARTVRIRTVDKSGAIYDEYFKMGAEKSELFGGYRDSILVTYKDLNAEIDDMITTGRRTNGNTYRYFLNKDGHYIRSTSPDVSEITDICKKEGLDFNIVPVTQEEETSYMKKFLEGTVEKIKSSFN